MNFIKKSLSKSCYCFAVIILLGCTNSFCESQPLVLDRCGFNHTVVLLDSQQTNQPGSVIADKALRFFFGRGGAFVLFREDLRWYAGGVRAGQPAHPISPPFASVSSASVSSEGSLVAWASSGHEQVLQVTSAASGHTNVVWSLSTNGIIGAAAWSPTGRKLAYFCGPSSAAASDGFCLALVDLEKTKPLPERLAPPSLYTRLSPVRPDPPRWCPDGTKILFESRYAESKEPLGGESILDLHTRAIFPAAPGCWSSDSKSFYVVDPIWNRNGRLETKKLSRSKVLSDRIEREPSGITLPAMSAGFEVSPNGAEVAFTTSDSAYVLNLATTESRKLASADMQCKVYWLR
jgi:Tol biopolymer transport system component